MAGEQTRTEDWKTLPWKKFQRNTFRLQKRIYQAQLRGDFKRVRGLQRLLLRSYSARNLAVRQVSQDNRGKNTPGVDGIAHLTPKQPSRQFCQTHLQSNGSPASLETLQVGQMAKPPFGRCLHCGLYFATEDHLETHHRNGNHNDNSLANLVLLHGHCHDEVHRTKYS